MDSRSAWDCGCAMMLLFSYKKCSPIQEDDEGGDSEVDAGEDDLYNDGYCLDADDNANEVRTYTK